MGRRARREREEAELAREKQITGRLQSHSSQKKKKPEILTYENISFGLIDTYRENWIKSPSTWVNRHKTKNKDTLRLDLVRHVFGIYNCPRFLETIWLPEETVFRRRNWQRNPAEDVNHQHDNLEFIFIPWYLAVAQGKSLYKECTKGILSKKETHAFLMAPNEFKVQQNIWWARACCESNGDIGLAGKIARSNLRNKDIESEFWISAMRFFVRFPTTIAEMNDLMDYFNYALAENENYSLKGRSLEAVKKSCEVWHRFLNKQRTIGGGSWDGAPLDDWTYVQGKDQNKTIWQLVQIKTGNELLKEGQAMRHCVASYKRQCMEGNTYIWSMKSTDMFGSFKRNLTIEMNKFGDIVQCRGLANRAARPHERAILSRWCSENNLRLKEAYYF